MQFLEKPQNVRKRRVIKLVITEKRRNYLVLEPNCHKTIFLKICWQQKWKKHILMNKPVYLDL